MSDEVEVDTGMAVAEDKQMDKKGGELMYYMVVMKALPGLT